MNASAEQGLKRRIGRALAGHQFVIMLIGAIVLSMLMLAIAMIAYNKSDASSLDLSRPDYDRLRSKITKEKPSTLSASGPINEAFLKEFDDIYGAQANEATEIDAFGGQVLTDEALGIASE